MRFRHLAAIVCFLVCAGLAQAVHAAPGDYGAACLPDSTCNQGRCIGNRCIHCGDEGEVACLDPNNKEYCSATGYGFGPRAGPNVGGPQVCRNTQASKCGHVGYPTCKRPDGTRYCITGIVRAVGNNPLVTFCEHCGFYWQRCCPNTPFECDYGVCDKKQNRCVPTGGDKAHDEAQAKIAECDFAEATRLIMGMPITDPRRQKLLDRRNRKQAAQTKAQGIYNNGRGAKRAGDQSFRALKFSEAADYYRRALVLFRRARQVNQCNRSGQKISKAISITERNLAQIGLALQSVTAIKACKFNQAKGLIARLPSSVQSALAPKLKAARKREQRTRSLYASGKRYNDAGRVHLRSRRQQQALHAFTRAKGYFERAYANSRCANLRSTIRKAIGATGRNMKRASAGGDSRGGKPCSQAQKNALFKMVKGYQNKWYNRWCRPHNWSGCAIVPNAEAGALNASIRAASNATQCAWVPKMAGCKNRCVMNYLGDKGSAQRHRCLKSCNRTNPWPTK